jgi:hypothetical protein
MLPTKFCFIWQGGYRREDFLEITRNKNCLWQARLLMNRDDMNNFYRGPSKFRFIWPSGFRGEDFLKSTNQKQELPVAAMFGNGSGLPYLLPTKFQFIWLSGFRGED